MSKLFFDESVIFLNLEGDTAEKVLRIMSANLVEKGLVKKSFIPAILKREREFATGLPTGSVPVAIPHTDVEHVKQKSISVAVLKNPVDFVVMGEESKTIAVRLVFMLAMDEAHSQLTFLQKLMQIFQEEEILKKIAEAKDKTFIRRLLEEKLNLVAFKGGDK
ncbi:PTS sugar transporter subunit IIA [Thermoactinomyces sp. AMNI-1]|uniref:PTS sugar transporter subunit IIA n=2 Tax=Thermoactinomyces mirandus TaxID=2756294 RepID=A0A7W2ATT3_9BACL|nr:PTS sugar transporter subunit IIA [Thermoactinomyces mirandus]